MFGDGPPAALSFPPCRKRQGRKGALGRVWCVLRVRFREAPKFQSLRAHKLTLRALNYAPPVTGHQIYKQLRLNECGKLALRSKLARQYGFALVLLSAKFQHRSCYRGKSPEKPKRFFWSVQGGPGEIEIPPGSFSFASVFFWRSKRKCCAAVANLQKIFSLAAGSFNNPPASGTAPAEARCIRPASGPSLRASAGRSPACACPARPPEAFRSGCAPYSAGSPCRGN